MKTIETSRLLLRSLTVSDATEEYASWLNDKDVNRFLETRHSVQTKESCKAFIEECNNDINTHLFGIFAKDTGCHIGNAKIGFVHALYRKGQISIVIGNKAYWGLGLSTEVVSALTDFAFSELKLNKLEAGCYDLNLASLKVFLNNGYSVEGFFKDHAILDGKYVGCFWLGKINNGFQF